ncbi:MAG: class I SAM-dependent methyltransferase [Spirochaetaceae bacterium]|jgi:SAM-dependent methyltransferase|nr:class I SAM-dependent methyltransferase [Spirochaetaceae bacterium]
MKNYLKGNLYSNTAGLYDYDNRNIIKDDLDFYVEYANKTNGEILELASGTGRVSLYVAEKTGRKLECIELSEKMVERFNHKLQTTHKYLQKNINIQTGDMADFKFDREFEYIIIPWRALQYLPETEQAIKCLSNVYNHLSDNGLFVFDIFKPRTYDDKWIGREDVSYDIMADGKRIIRSTVNYSADTINRNIQYKTKYRIIDDGKETVTEDLLTYKYYERDEIVDILKMTGLTVKEEYGYYDKRTIADGDEMIFICGKLFDS